MTNTNDTNTSEIRQSLHENIDNAFDAELLLKENSSNYMNKIKENSAQIRAKANGYIERNPEKSVLIAVGIGAIVGAILATAIRRKG